MASVEPYRWRPGAACQDETTKPPHGEGCRCKVLVWRARWRTPEGRSRSLNFDRKRDADAHVAGVETGKHRGVYVDAAGGRQRFIDAADEWAAAQDWKASTRRGWPKKRKRLVWAFGDIRLGDVTTTRFNEARNKLAGRYARSTVEGDMARAKAIMRTAFLDGKIGRDVTTGVASAPKLRAGEPTGKVTPEVVPTRAEALELITSAGLSWRAAMALGTAGCRVGEVLGLHAEAVDLAARKVTICQQTDGYDLTTVKNERNRTVIVPQLVAVELRRHLRDHPGGLLFQGGGRECPCGCGGRLLHRERFYELAWYPTLRAAGMSGRFVFHGLRHFCASNLLAEGAPLPAVAGYLGDVVQTVARVYSHWLRDDAEVPAAVLDRVLAPSGEGAVAEAVTQP